MKNLTCHNSKVVKEHLSIQQTHILYKGQMHFLPDPQKFLSLSLSEIIIAVGRNKENSQFPCHFTAYKIYGTYPWSVDTRLLFSFPNLPV